MRTYYDLEKALKNPETPREVCIFLDREDPALLDDLHKFVNLKKLSLLDSEKLTSLPLSILKLTQLEVLRLRGASIETLPKNFGDLKGLKTLEIERVPLRSFPASIGQLKHLNYIDTRTTKLESLPDSIGNLTRLVNLELWDSQIAFLPNSIAQLKALKSFEISSPKLEALPDVFGELTNLESVYVRDSPIKKLPDSFAKLEKLRNLDCRNSKLSSLPTGIKAMKNLYAVDLEGNCFTSFPDELCHCETLHVMTFRGNNLTDLPESLGNLKNLDRVDFSENNFKSLPYILLDWGDTFALNDKWGFNIGKHLYNNAKIFDLLNKKAFRALSREAKIHYYHIYINDHEAMAQLDPIVLRQALNAKVSIVADNALDYLTKDSAKKISESSKLLIWGKTTKEKTAFITQIESCGISSSIKYSAAITHVLVSARGNKKLDKLPQNVHWEWVTEAQLIAYAEKKQPSFLVESSNKDSIEQVVNLIMTFDEENMALALELITGGGLPPELITEVFVVYKLSEVAETRKKAQKLLKQKASSDLQQVLRRRTNIRQNKSYYFDEDYRALREKLNSYTENTTIDLGVLAYAVAVKSNYGYALALDNAPKHLREKLLQEVLIKSGDTFDLPYHEHLKKFPIELLDFPELKKISIDMDRGSWDRKGVWQANTLFKIPTDIFKLNKLEELQIWPGILHELPVASLCQMKSLKRILLRVDKSIDFSPLKEALPHCDIDIRKN